MVRISMLSVVGNVITVKCDRYIQYGTVPTVAYRIVDVRLRGGADRQADGRRTLAASIVLSVFTFVGVSHSNLFSA